MLAKVRRWQPFDGDAALDDVAAVLDTYPPAEKQSEELGVRLPAHLKRLMDIALATGAAQGDETTAQLLVQAHTVFAQDTPDGYWPTVGHLRRTAWTVNELLDRLVELGCLREAA